MKFYKYRPISNVFANDYALDALFKSYAVFSTRKNFNDVLDSKINIILPTPAEVLELSQDPRLGGSASEVESWISGGKFTTEGQRMLKQGETELNALFDSYPLFCVSDRNDSHLLWAHYASSHSGFCIEFEFPGKTQPTPVRYQKNLESIPLLDFFKVRFGLVGPELGDRAHAALLVKLEHWSYESEYRWIASNEMGQISRGKKFITFEYEPDWIKAIIFGCRMSSEAKEYILEHLPFPTDFRQAVEDGEDISIVSFDKYRHL